MSTDDHPTITSPSKQFADMEQASTARAAALLAPLEAKVRALKAQERAELRGATLAAASEHLRITLFPKVYEDAGQRTAEGVTRAADELLRMVSDPHVPTVAWPSQQALDKAALDVPISSSVVYAVRGRPEVPDEYNETRTIAPTKITLTYRASTDSQLGRVHAYVQGWWMHDGARVHAEAVGRHFTGDPANWPGWLAAEARQRDPDVADQEQRDEQEAQAHLDLLAEQLPATDLLKRTESYLSALHGSVGRHDNFGENLGCAGCQLRDQLRAELRRLTRPTDGSS